MFDPGALGTLIIGLNANRAETRNDRRSRPVVAQRQGHPGLRVSLARGLRRAAALLDQPRVGESST
jgi:hypothetical protein